MSARIAVVTGASGGIGSEICKLLAEQGIHLVLVDRSQAKMDAFVDGLGALIQGSVIATFPVDLADKADRKRACQALLARFPSVEFLFNNAGVLTETLKFAASGNELHFEINTLAPLQIIDELRPALAAAKGAVVVNTTAGLSLRADTLDMRELVSPSTFQKLFGPYVNSKAALNVLTSALAVELAGEHIALRAADPGPTRTALTKGPGTPLWMRLFYRFLPSPSKGALKIVDAALSARWSSASGAMISGGAIKALPIPLSPPPFQRKFLAQCRRLIE